MTDLQAVAERTWILTGSPENYAVWPGKPGKPDSYPWRLEHVRKWPAENWTLEAMERRRAGVAV